MVSNEFYPRFIQGRLHEALEDSPVVLIQGPRQCGKTTLAQTACASHAYFSFDDDAIREGAIADPIGFVANLPERVVLDEAQRVPSLFTTLKLEVDRRRAPGRFVLTGSTNVLAVPAIQDSLAGRLEAVRLHPLAQCEMQDRSAPSGGFIAALFGGGFSLRKTARLGTDLAERIASGGYPAALARPAGRRRVNWYANYIEALVQRDVGDLSRISSLEALPRLLALAAAHTARLFNVSSLAAPFQLSRPTIGQYLTLLERVYLLERLPSWHRNLEKRLVKTPKLHIGDTGLACALTGVDAAALYADRVLLGQFLETFVFQELRRQATWQDGPVEFFHYRDKDQVEVDIVIEQGRRVAGVEVKAGATVTNSDFRGLRRLKEASGDAFAAGAVLYDGETVVGFGDGLYAVPVRLLWETP